MVARRGLLKVIQKHAAYRNFSDMLLFGCELGQSIFLDRLIKTSPFVKNRLRDLESTEAEKFRHETIDCNAHLESVNLSV